MRRTLSVIMILFVTLASCESQAKNKRIRSGRSMQEQLTEVNAVYLIKERIDLDGATVMLPANSTLKFKRKGFLTNGTIQGNGTQLSGKPRFDSVRLKGKYATHEFYASWSSARSISDYIEDVMNLGGESTVVVDCDITLNDQKKYVDHLYLKGNKKTITNSDRYYITYGGTNISDLYFCWDKGPVQEPKDNYSAVVIYWDLMQKDTIITTSIRNVEADGGRYCSFFMKQHKSAIQPQLKTISVVENCTFSNFTRGAIWACGGKGSISDCRFQNIGYETTTTLLSVYPLRLGYSDKVGAKGKAVGYTVSGCTFSNMVASFSSENDGRELHGLLAYGDSIIVMNNQFLTLSTSFSKPTDTGMDSEMLYIKGSHNLIENNYFENGAGSSSDAVVTLKVGQTEGNVIRENRFLMSSTNGKFVYIAGRNHLVEDNELHSTYDAQKETDAYAIYLKHQAEVSGFESIIIRNNTFSFTDNSNYTAIYANSWGDLTLNGNTFDNPYRLLKCNKREGIVQIHNNKIRLDGIRGNVNDSFILISSAEGQIVTIEDNIFDVTDSEIGRLVTGTNYRFSGNKLLIKSSSIESFLRGSDTHIEASDNIIASDDNTKISRRAIVGEKNTSKIQTERNQIVGRSIRGSLE